MFFCLCFSIDVFYLNITFMPLMFADVSVINVLLVDVQSQMYVCSIVLLAVIREGVVQRLWFKDCVCGLHMCSIGTLVRLAG